MARNVVYILTVLLLLSSSTNSFSLAALDVSEVKPSATDLAMHMEHCNEESNTMDSVCMDHCAAVYAVFNPFFTQILLDIPRWQYSEITNRSPDALLHFHWRPPSLYS